MRVALRDGERVLVKHCRLCGLDKVCSPVTDVSEFAIDHRPGSCGHASYSWKAYCKECMKANRRRENPETQRARQQRRRQEMRTDSVRGPAFRADAQKRTAKWAASEKGRKSRNAASRRWRKKKAVEDPTYFRDHHRVARRLRAERAGKTITVESTVMDSHAGLQVPAAAFTKWAQAYGRVAGIRTATQLAEHLGLDERRMRAVHERRSEEDLVALGGHGVDERELHGRGCRP